MSQTDVSNPPPSDDRIGLLIGIARRLITEIRGDHTPVAITADSRLDQDLGLGSLERVEFFLRIEKEFGVSLGDEAASSLTIGEVFGAIHRAPPSPAETPGPRSLRPETRPGLLRGARRKSGTFHTLTDALVARCEEDPQAIHAFFREGDNPERTLTRGALREGAARAAQGLRDRGIRPGDTVALMLPTGEAFLECFLGVLASGAVAVPLYPPLRGDRMEAFAERHAAIFRTAETRILIGADRIRELAPILRAIAPVVTSIVSPEELLSSNPGEIRIGNQLEPALVQFTSGSTDLPKGVLLDHEALLANIRSIGEAVNVREGDAVASWLPLYHDMGLVGSWLFALVHGLPITLLPSASFLVRPERWLEAISAHRATLSAAPNFAYDLVARRVTDETLGRLDLSSWREALNGSEPVVPATLDSFANRLRGAGFRRESLRPVYGLAESSVALAFPPAQRGPRIEKIDRGSLERDAVAVPADPASSEIDSISLVSVGPALPGHEIRIVGDDAAPVPERRVGRIVFRGPSCLTEYFRAPEATAAITVRIDGHEFFDSGDLGFLDETGELFITGRRKEIIIRGGRNLSPSGIESAAQSVDGVHAAAAIGVRDLRQATERLIVVVESRKRGEEKVELLRHAVLEAVSNATGAPPDEVRIVAPGDLPRTSSGKIRRRILADSIERESTGQRLEEPLPAAKKTAAPLPSIARRVFRFLHGALLALFALPTLGILWLVAKLMGGEAAGRAVRTACRLFFRLALSPVRIRGEFGIPSGAILAANHSSWADVPVLLAALPPGIAFVAKEELLAWPIVGTFLEKCGHIPVARADRAKSLEAAAKGIERLESGGSVLFFPEGTFSRDPGILPFRLGAFRSAVETGRPIVPIGVRGVRRFLPDGDWLPWISKIEVEIGPPILPEEEGWSEILRLRDETRTVLVRMSGESPLI